MARSRWFTRPRAILIFGGAVAVGVLSWLAVCGNIAPIWSAVGSTVSVAAAAIGIWRFFGPASPPGAGSSLPRLVPWWYPYRHERSAETEMFLGFKNDGRGSARNLVLHDFKCLPDQIDITRYRMDGLSPGEHRQALLPDRVTMERSAAVPPDSQFHRTSALDDAGNEHVRFFERTSSTDTPEIPGGTVPPGAPQPVKGDDSVAKALADAVRKAWPN